MTDNLALWDKVSKTNPKYTKPVNQRGGFTAISAQYQIMEATKAFGPLGVGWGYDADKPIFHDNLVFVSVTLWHGDRSNTFGPMTGGAEWRSAKGHLDSDAPKKATTDAVTKLLSQLGFNADVFLGLFDDNKYVAQLKAEFASDARDADGPDASLQLSLDGIAKAETLVQLKEWWDRNSGAIPDHHTQTITEAYKTRGRQINAMGRMAA